MGYIVFFAIAFAMYLDLKLRATKIDMRFLEMRIESLEKKK